MQNTPELIGGNESIQRISNCRDEEELISQLPSVWWKRVPLIRNDFNEGVLFSVLDQLGSVPKTDTPIFHVTIAWHAVVGRNFSDVVQVGLSQLAK